MRFVLLLVLLAAALGAGWFLRDRWSVRDAGDVAADTAVVWEAISTEGADRARRSIEELGQRGSPVFVGIRPGDLASHIFVSLARKLPPSAENIEAAVIEERLYVRATVKPGDLGGAAALGALGGFLADREPMQLGGYFHVIKPALAEFIVTDLSVGSLAVPEPLIPRLIARFSTGARPEGVADNGLPIEVPTYIADVRISRGTVVLYRTTP